MIPFIGPEFVALLLSDRPNSENLAGTTRAARELYGAVDKPKFLVKLRLIATEITQLTAVKGEIR